MKKEYFFQAILIFISVFLGIMATNWNESYKQHQKTKAFLANLVIELKFNKEKVGKSIVYHETLKVVGDSVFSNMDKATLNEPLISYGDFENVGFTTFPKWKGLGLNTLESSVYQSGLTSGVLENIPIELLTKISKVKSIQKEYLRLAHSLSDKLLGFNSDTKFMEFMIIIKILGGDIYYFEKTIDKLYHQLITDLEGHIGG